jgi:UDP-2-acetamido-2-deoxy-ribo-hexuluronate aminotransferase
MNINFANLQLQYQKYKIDIDVNIQAVLNKSNYIVGEKDQEFERSLEEFSGAKYSMPLSAHQVRMHSYLP